MTLEADYVVIGAGSAGCTLAGRLAASGRHSVLLIEAGGSDARFLMKMPLSWRDSFKNPDVNWGYSSEGEPGANMRCLPAHRGKVVGGTSSINGMLYARGFPQDYDKWRDRGLIGWAWSDVLPYFLKAEASWRGQGAIHGGDGPVAVTQHRPEPALREALGRAAIAAGLSVPEDIYTTSGDHFGIPDFTIFKGRRASSATSYLQGLARGHALRTITNAHVTRVLFAGREARGVEVLWNGVLHEARARSEVILCGGAFNSPQLLMLSGVGLARHLRTHGIAIVQNSTGVGQNLQDHHAVNFSYRLAPQMSFARQLRLDRMILSVLRWIVLRNGIAATVPVSGQIFRRIDEHSVWPDMQMVITPVGHDADLWMPGWRASKGDVLAATNVLLRPDSTGSVELRSASPRDSPRIRFNVLGCESDRTRFRSMVRFTQAFFALPELAHAIPGLISPDNILQEEDQIDSFVRSAMGTAMHPAGTCAMGADASAVLDAQCRVRGLGRIRVVDASAMPHVVSGNTNAPVIMMAEKAADMILGGPSHPSRP